jgi:nitrogenase iron protein NifH
MTAVPVGIRVEGRMMTQAARKVRQIAFYGKGGIGKSTVSANLSAALSHLGYRVLHIGCDPKADSTRNLLNSKSISHVLDHLDTKGATLTLEDVVVEGYGGVYCIEAGGPEPGVGCAGRGIISLTELVQQLDIVNKLAIDVVIYDVLGDVVCGGFAVPLRMGFAEEVYLVTSGEIMALFAANNIAKAIKRFATRNKVRLSGIICNKRNIEFEDEVVAAFACAIGTGEVFHVPRDRAVQLCENEGKTVVQGQPDHPMAQVFDVLARKILGNAAGVVPDPLDDLEFNTLIKKCYAT